MLGNMEHDAVAADLHVERRARFEPMLPVHRKAEPIDIELARLGLIEAAEHRDGDKKDERHRKIIDLSRGLGKSWFGQILPRNAGSARAAKLRLEPQEAPMMFVPSRRPGGVK